MRKNTTCLAILALGSALSLPAHALNIVVSNDDGLTSNVKALYDALKGAGHDVIVSVPCTQQSGRGGGVVMYSTDKLVATQDADITKNGGCRNGAAKTGEPSVGAMTRSGYDNGDWYYAHGTPVMALMYGLDVPAAKRWGKAPDLVVSGPNEGSNVGGLNITSGTIGITQFALIRSIPAMAFSVSSNAIDDTNLANPQSQTAANLTLKLIQSLNAQRTSTGILPKGVALNVNFPSNFSATSTFAFSRIGTFNLYELGFQSTAPYGYRLATRNDPAKATAEQKEDESVVISDRISVVAMQLAFDHRPAAQEWLRMKMDTVNTTKP
ncbi:5'/3'-nucleotidase SurE [Diaphorobacter sp. HDW4A]|uniref:5'/3'-nucleotidase SurE n=1 Tax=Diaphorobacter sp. HDW4A TaxID=2714924 RepID=UPI001F11630E|nr:5'/3'-nucleotidase SurE [Diaphorobacter sp. HDW4A]